MDLDFFNFKCYLKKLEISTWLKSLEHLIISETTLPHSILFHTITSSKLLELHGFYFSDISSIQFLIIQLANNCVPFVFLCVLYSLYFIGKKYSNYFVRKKLKNIS